MVSRSAEMSAHSRRRFLARGLAFVATGAVMPAAFVRAVFAEAPPASSASNATRRTLVVLQLGGGNDGLNTLIPYADGAYYDARRELAVNPEAVLHLDGRIGLHPNLAGLKELYDPGVMAIVEGVGYPIRTGRTSAPWRYGTPRSTAADVYTGWLGRLLDATHHEQDSRWKAANVGAAAPLSLTTEETFVPSLRSVPAYVLQVDPRLAGSPAADRRVTDWARLYARQAAFGGKLALVSETGLDAYRSTVDLAAEVSDYAPRAEYPHSPLGDALQTCAQLAVSNLGTGICYVTTGDSTRTPRRTARTPSCSPASRTPCSPFAATWSGKASRTRSPRLCGPSSGVASAGTAPEAPTTAPPARCS